MNKLLAFLALAPIAFGQTQLGPRVFSSGTYANRPSSPATGTVYIVTDHDCAGLNTGPTNCRYNGATWDALGGATSSQTSIFSGGTQVQRFVQCAHGTVLSTALTAASLNQEITIQTGITGDVRWDQVAVSETVQFAGTTGLTVSMGRTGSNNAEMTGVQVPLMVSSGDTNYWSSRPIPPQLTSTYSIVLNFAVASGTVNTASTGTLTWELCGFSAR